MSGSVQDAPPIVLHMRFFESWWEHLATVARLAPVIIVLAAAIGRAVARPMGYYWE